MLSWLGYKECIVAGNDKYDVDRVARSKTAMPLPASNTNDINIDVPELYKVNVEGKERTFQTIEEVDLAAQKLHRKMIDETTRIQSDNVLYSIAGAVVGTVGTSRFFIKLLGDGTAFSEAKLKQLDELFQPIRDVAANGNTSLTDSQLEKDTVQIIRKLENRVRLSTKEKIAAGDSIEELIKPLFDTHFKASVLEIGLPEEKLGLAQAYLARVIKDGVHKTLRIDTSLPFKSDVHDIVDGIFAKSAPVLNVARSGITNFFEKEHAGVWKHEIVHLPVIAGALVVGAVVGDVVHDVLSTSQQKKIEDMGHDIEALNHVMVTHHKPMIDTTDVPNKSIKARVVQEQERHRRIQLQAHDDVMAKHQEIREAKKADQKPDSKTVHSPNYEGIANNTAISNHQQSL